MNGKRGVAMDFHPLWVTDALGQAVNTPLSRYTVELDGGEIFKLKVVNVRAVNADRECAENAEAVLADVD